MSEALHLSSIVLLLLILFAVRRLPTHLAASEHDWYIVFDVDAESKVIGLWFFPDVALSHNGFETRPVLSNPNDAYRLAKSRPEVKVNNEDWGLSYSYGRWYRGNISLKEDGKPETVFPDDFVHYLGQAFLAGFTVSPRSQVPTLYQRLIQRARLLASRARE